MANPYTPQQPGSYDPSRTARDGTQADPRRPTPVVDAPRSGFGTRMVVALVFVVIAILAAVFFRPDGTDIGATAPASEITPVEDGTATTGTETTQPEAGGATVDPTTGTADPATGTADPTTGTADPVTPPATAPADGATNP